MKKIVISNILLFSYLYSYSLSPDEITKMISKIKEKRVGISIGKLESTSNPFIIVQPKKEENLTKEVEKTPIYIPKVIVEPTYTLSAILNHSVFINKKWYKKGDKIGKYRVIYIGKKSVVIKSKEKKKTLKLKKRKHIKLH